MNLRNWHVILAIDIGFFLVWFCCRPISLLGPMYANSKHPDYKECSCLPGVFQEPVPSSLAAPGTWHWRAESWSRLQPPPDSSFSSSAAAPGAVLCHHQSPPPPDSHLHNTCYSCRIAKVQFGCKLILVSTCSFWLATNIAQYSRVGWCQFFSIKTTMQKLCTKTRRQLDMPILFSLCTCLVETSELPLLTRYSMTGVCALLTASNSAVWPFWPSVVSRFAFPWNIDI